MIGSATKAAPKLRFLAFSGVWQAVQLSSIAKIYDGTHQTPSYAKQGVPFYSVEHVTADDFTSTKFISEEVYAQEIKRVALQRGDILMTRIGDIGTAKYIDWDVRASFYVSLALIKQSNKYSGRFLSQYIATTMFQNELWRRTIHVAFPKKINLGEIGNCIVRLPSLEEQQKIADFLTAVDDRVAVIDERLQLLKKYKKGVMQKIFTQKIRFKDENGKEYPDWENVKLGKFLSVSDKEIVTHIDKNKILTVRLHRKGVMPSTNTGTLKIGSTNYYRRHAGELIYGKQNLFSGAIDLIPEHLDGYLSSGDVPSLRVDANIVNPRYLILCVGRKDYYAKLAEVASGSGSRRIHEKTLQDQLMPLPGREEQQKIADFLTAIDDKIKLEETRLTQAKKFKKSLLQRMFI